MALRVGRERFVRILLGAGAFLLTSGPLEAVNSDASFHLGLLPRTVTQARAARAPSYLEMYPRAPFSPIVQAEIYEIPTIDGALAVWMAGWGLNGDGSQNPVTSWGYNTRTTAQFDPAFRMIELTFEASYLNPQGFHQAEAYLQFQDLDGTYRRPLQFEIPFEGPNALETVGFTSTNWFSFLDATSQRQRVKIYDIFALARNVPLFFTDTPDCAGCGADVGLEPQAVGELAVVLGVTHGLGDFKASAVRAVALYGDGSGITGLNASAITTGTLPESVLPASVRSSSRTAAAVRNETVGQAVLRGGKAVVATTAVRAGSRIFLTYAGAVGRIGTLFVGGIVDGARFEIRSTSPTDDSPVNYWILDSDR
jgi:hypothetical protein